MFVGTLFANPGLRGRLKVTEDATSTAAGSDPTVTGESGVSDFRIEQAPGHGPNFVEEFESGGSLGLINGAGLGEKSEMGVYFLCRTVRDSPMVHPIASEPSMTFGEIGRNRRC